MRNIIFATLILIESFGYSQVTMLYKINCGTQNKRAQEFFDAGNAGMQLNRLSEAKQLFYAAALEDSTFCDAWDHMSTCCIRLGHFKDAFTAGVNSLAIDSTNAVAWANCGYASFLDNDINRSLISFYHMQRILPDNPEGYYGMSMVFYSINEINEAKINIMLAKEKYINDGFEIGPEVDLLNGFIEYKQGNLIDAQKLFQKIYRKFKDNAELNYYLSECLLINENDTRKSNSYKNKALKLGYVPENEVSPSCQ